jgi:hypothetical protein
MHLLAAVTNESSTVREALAGEGLASRLLDLAEQWMQRHGAGVALISVPKWLDASLLTLEALAKFRSKVGGVVGAPAAEGQQSEQSVGQAAAADGGQAAAPAEAALATGDIEIEAAPSILVPPPMAQQEQPGIDVERAVKAVAGQWRLGGLLSDSEQERAADVCIALIPGIIAWGADWRSPAMPKAGDDEEAEAAAEADVIRSEDPRSSLQAALQLLARLTLRYELAAKARFLL